MFQIKPLWLEKLVPSHFLEEEVQFQPLDSVLCIVGNYLVARGFVPDGTATFNALNLRTFEIANQWSLPCRHSLEKATPLPLVSYEIKGQEFVLEGCAACEVIRIHNVEKGHVFEAYGGVEPYQICTGPAQTIFVFDGKAKTILQLSPTIFDCVVRAMSLDMQIVGMKYFDNADVLVLAGTKPPTLMGVKMRKRRHKVLWQYLYEVGDLPLNPTDVAITHPTKLVCVANKDGVLVLNPSDGSVVLHKLLQEANLQSIEWVNDNLITSQTHGPTSVYKYKLSYPGTGNVHN